METTQTVLIYSGIAIVFTGRKEANQFDKYVKELTNLIIKNSKESDLPSTNLYSHIEYARQSAIFQLLQIPNASIIEIIK